jgi:hypothetical protein
MADDLPILAARLRAMQRDQARRRREGDDDDAERPVARRPTEDERATFDRGVQPPGDRPRPAPQRAR